MSVKPALIVPMMWLLPFASITAQALPVKAGDRVRVRANDEYVGTLLQADSSRLLLQRPDAPDTIAIPMAEVDQVAVFGGRHSAAGYGAKLGAVIGGTLGLAAGIGAQCSVNGDSFICGGPELIVGGVFFGALFGAVPGALIGSTTHRERWDPVPLDGLQIGITRTPHGPALGLSLAARF